MLMNAPEVSRCQSWPFSPTMAARALVTTLFLLGDLDNVFVPGFHKLGWNIVWLSVMYWFILELKRKKEAVQA